MARGSEKEKSFMKHLMMREVGLKSDYSKSYLPSHLIKIVNDDFKDVLKCIDTLKKAIASKKWSELELTISDALNTLIDHISRNGRLSAVRKKQLRSLFISFGGLDILLKVFTPPFLPLDARSAGSMAIKEHAEVWNEIFVILRELLVAIPHLGEKYFSEQTITTLFTILHHPVLFENGIHVLEEILASREDTFPLMKIPRFYSLVKSFSSRQLALFSRLLSLLIFEPEDRHIMEGSQVLKSMDLLVLRRCRMAKASHCVVEQNQNLILHLPELLPRYLQVLSVINYGPPLQDLISHSIITQSPMTSDVLIFNPVCIKVSDWDYFAKLDEIVTLHREMIEQTELTSRAANEEEEDEEDENEEEGTATAGTTGDTTTGGSSAGSSAASSLAAALNSVNRNRRTTAASAANTSTPLRPIIAGNANRELLAAFSPLTNQRRRQQQRQGSQAAGSSSAAASSEPPLPSFELQSLVNVIQVAQRLQVADITPLGQALLITQDVYHPTVPPGVGIRSSGREPANGATGAGASMNSNNYSRGRLYTSITRREQQQQQQTSGSKKVLASLTASEIFQARQELQFHAMLLLPHQIEIVFVLCTFLSGRRKLLVQQMLAQQGLGRILAGMFDRMSWSQTMTMQLIGSVGCTISGEGGCSSEELTHVHGPHCECTPESAIRIQFLRLIHNYYDRDFLGNENKYGLLTEQEKQFLLTGEEQGAAGQSGLGKGGAVSSICGSSGGQGPAGQGAGQGQGGLISKLCLVLKGQSASSNYRFWLSACVENFLRGAGRQAQWLFHHQHDILTSTISSIFAIHQLEHDKQKQRSASISVAASIAASTTSSGSSSLTQQQSYQTSFDLLGEMMKANPRMFIALEQCPLLVAEVAGEEEEAAFDCFMKVCMNHLVDSNVFVRSMYLTLELMSVASSADQAEADDQADHDDLADHDEDEADYRYATENSAEEGPVFEYFGWVKNALYDSHSDDKSATKVFSELTTRGYLAASWIEEQPMVSQHALLRYQDNDKDKKKQKQENAVAAVKKAVASSSYSSSSSSGSNSISMGNRIDSKVDSKADNKADSKADSKVDSHSTVDSQQPAAAVADTKNKASQMEVKVVSSTTGRLPKPVTATATSQQQQQVMAESKGEREEAKDTGIGLFPPAVNSFYEDCRRQITALYANDSKSSKSIWMDDEVPVLPPVTSTIEDNNDLTAYFTPPEGPKYSKRSVLTPATATPATPATTTATDVSSTAASFMAASAIVATTALATATVTITASQGNNNSSSNGSSGSSSGSSSSKVDLNIMTQMDDDQDQDNGYEDDEDDEDDADDNKESLQQMNKTDNRRRSRRYPKAGGELAGEQRENGEEMMEETYRSQQISLSRYMTPRAAAKPTKKKTTASSFTIPSKISRFATFLQREKFQILLRLMITISIQTINHENVCCLNTILLILLFDYQRGTLAETLEKIRQLADQIGNNHDNDDEGRERGVRNGKKEETVSICMDCLTKSYTNGTDHGTGSTTSTVAHDNGDVQGCCVTCILKQETNYLANPANAADNDMDPNSIQASLQRLANRKKPESSKDESTAVTTRKNSTLVMMNFRALLWYWQEHYLRLGRDRLSIEFSAHIPFHYWYELVVELCIDNAASPYSLLPTPLTDLPMSPYQYSNEYCLLRSKHSMDDQVIMHVNQSIFGDAAAVPATSSTAIQDPTSVDDDLASHLQEVD